MVFKKIKEKFFKKVGTPADVEEEVDYVELDSKVKEFENKIQVKFFELQDFSDIKQIIDSIRQGYTICLVHIKELKDKDVSELKRAVEKIKKSVAVSEGDIKGFGNEWLIIVPNFVEIIKEKQKSQKGL